VNWQITACILMCAAVLLLYGSWSVDAPLRALRRHPLRAVTALKEERARIRVRVVDAVQPLYVPVSHTPCCAYQLRIEAATSDQPLTLLRQAESVCFRVADSQGERLLRLQDGFDLHYSFGEVRKVTLASERLEIEQLTDERLGNSTVSLALTVIAPGMELEIGGRFSEDGNELVLHDGFIAPPDAKPVTLMRPFRQRKS
jgi:hypothetical protein